MKRSETVGHLLKSRKAPDRGVGNRSPYPGQGGESNPERFPVAFVRSGGNDVSGDATGACHASHPICALFRRGRNYFRDRFTETSNAHRLAGPTNLFEDPRAVGLELRNSNFFHRRACLHSERDRRIGSNFICELACDVGNWEWAGLETCPTGHPAKIRNSSVSMNPQFHNTAMKIDVGGVPAAPPGLLWVGALPRVPPFGSTLG